MADYRVQTEVYNGPMDLLLYLIRRDEINICDIPIAHVTGQYLEYVRALQAIDPNVAGEFLVLATVLMEIKSRMLLPRPPAEQDGEEDLSDPRLELVRQLLEYKKFKDASLELGAAAADAADRWARFPAKPTNEKATIDLDDVQIWDLIAAFNKLMASIGAGAATHDVVFDDTPIALHAADILDRLCSRLPAGESADDAGRMEGAAAIGFEEIFAGRNKVEMIGLFLALLELMRQKRVKVTQAGLFAPIQIVLLSAEPIEIGDEWAPALREAALGESDQSRDRQEALGASPSESPTDVADDDDTENFADLDRIKTDVDIDSILDHVGQPPSAVVEERQ